MTDGEILRLAVTETPNAAEVFIRVHLFDLLKHLRSANL